MKADQYIRVIDFERTQHYKDRKPIWIKLYRDLLQDDRLFELSEGDRYQLVALLILASQHANLIPNKPAWLRKELSINRSISLQNLIDAGWIELLTQEQADVIHASNALAGRYQDAPRVEKSREEKNKSAASNGNGAHSWSTDFPKGAPLPDTELQRALDIEQRTKEIARQKDMRR